MNFYDDLVMQDPDELFQVPSYLCFRQYALSAD